MFVSKAFYIELAEARVEVRTLREQNLLLQTNLDHARLRLNQLERERQQMLYAVAGVKIAAPEFVQSPGAPATDALGELSSFDDMGDDAAAKFGVGWDEHGKVTYGRGSAAREGN